MKKTIAKIMAVAMVLSAVPAITLPTLTASAADTLTDASATTSTVTSETIAKNSYAIDGALTVNKTTGALPIVVNGATVSDDKKTLTITTTNGKSTVKLDTSTVGNDAVYKMAELEISEDGRVYVTANAGGSADKYQALINAVAKGENHVNVVLTVQSGDSNGTVQDEKTVTIDALVADGVVQKGATVGSEDDAYTVIAAGDKNEVDLQEGDVYAKIGSSGIEILKGDNKDLDSKDYFRTYTLDLTTVQILNADGVSLTGSLPVVKIGAQALKKAHMKRFYAENTKRIGKGALRGCKQVTKVDICDSNKVRKINSKAFYGDKNLKNIIIDGRKLNTVGSQAFKGVKKNCKVKIKATKSKYNSDVKLITKNGGNKNLKFIKK